MFKKFLAAMMITVISMTAVSAAAMADDGVKLIINGEKIDFSSDQEPVIQDGRALVPFRAVFEKMGAEVYWYEDIRLCEAVYDGITVGITIGDTTVYIGSASQIESDVPAQIINGRTMVPLRILSESIGAEVDWDSLTRTITVNTPQITGEAPEAVNYDTYSAEADGNVNVTYEYPVVTDQYTGADIINKNIAEDIKSAAEEIAASAETDETELNITYKAVLNSNGIFSVMYLIDGEMVYYNHYGIIDGARISDEAYAVITGGIETYNDDEVYSIDTYETALEDADGNNYIYASVSYPIFLGDEDYVPSLNTQLENSAKKAAESFINSYGEDALAIYENPPEQLYEVPYSFMGNCEVEITDENTAVIKTEYSELKYNEDLITYTDIVEINLENGEVIE